MDQPTNPQTYFAAERTYLAWVRSGLAVMGFGFVIARFGLFLRTIEHIPANPGHHFISNVIGVLLVVLGVTGILAASLQHWIYYRSLPASQMPTKYWPGMSLLFSLSMALIGAAMAGFLLFWTEHS